MQCDVVWVCNHHVSAAWLVTESRPGHSLEVVGTHRAGVYEVPPPPWCRCGWLWKAPRRRWARMARAISLRGTLQRRWFLLRRGMLQWYDAEPFVLPPGGLWAHEAAEHGGSSGAAKEVPSVAIPDMEQGKVHYEIAGHAVALEHGAAADGRWYLRVKCGGYSELYLEADSEEDVLAWEVAIRRCSSRAWT